MPITLKAARVNKGLTQAQAASLIGVTKDTISNWERNKNFPGVNMIPKIEEAYSVSYSDIIFFKKDVG